MRNGLHEVPSKLRRRVGPDDCTLAASLFDDALGAARFKEGSRVTGLSVKELVVSSLRFLQAAFFTRRKKMNETRWWNRLPFLEIEGAVCPRSEKIRRPENAGHETAARYIGGRMGPNGHPDG